MVRFYPTFFRVVFSGMDPERAHRWGFDGIKAARATGASRLLRAMCVDGTISIALVAQIVKTVQLTPADFHASTQTRHQNTAIRVERRFEQRHHRYFTAHRGEGRDG